MKSPIVLMSVLTAGMLAAQTAAPPANSNPAQSAGQQATQHATQHERWAARRARFARLTAGLNLTADQQKQVHEIFSQSRTEMKTLMPKFREDRAAMAGAVKSDSEQQIDKVAQQDAQLRAQMEAIHAKTLAKFYSILTPDQKAKVDQRMNRMLGYFPHHQGKRGSATGA